MTVFDPPGFLDDFTAAQKNTWSELIYQWMVQARAGRPSVNDGPREQFFVELDTPPAADAQVATISWNAFPRKIASSSGSNRQRWRRADARREVQDEYCEWSVTRNAAGQITRVTFTCEGPEYWEELARVNPDKVLELYRTQVSPNVTRQDLFPGGAYDPMNRFNNGTSNGAMHLIQEANTLGAEIWLAAAATIRRMHSGAELTDAQELIACSRYGEAGRNSDPFIGEQVNALARQRADVTLNNPVGLYLHAFNPVGLVTPDGADPRDFMRFVRGREGHSVRAVFEVPAAFGYTVSEIQDPRNSTRGIEFGAQLVDFLTIKLEGLATRFGQSTVTPFDGCHAASAMGAAPAAAVAVAATLAASRMQTRATVAKVSPEIAALQAQLPAGLQVAAAPQLEAAAALRPYPPLAASHLRSRQVTGQLLAYASPDSTFAVTRRLIDAARHSLVIAIYDFSASHMLDVLKAAMERGVEVTMLLDTNSGGEDRLFSDLEELGATCVESPSQSAGHPSPFFPNAHQKIVVVDSEIVMIQSGNWSSNSIPFNSADGDPGSGQFRPGNRDMGVAIHSRELAGFFAALIARDIRLSQGEEPGDLELLGGAAVVAGGAAGPAAADLFFEAAPLERPPALFSSLNLPRGQAFGVTPVLTPENFLSATERLLRSAQHSVRLEQQYIRARQATIRRLLTALAETRDANPDLDVRIVVSPKYLTPSERQTLEDAMAEFGFEVDTHLRYLSARHFVHCHNKLVVVDETSVLVGSQNWSTTGVASNREASLLIENPAVAGYFTGIFDADWDLGVETDVNGNAAFAADVAGLRQAGDFVRGGVVVSSVRDYREV